MSDQEPQFPDLSVLLSKPFVQWPLPSVEGMRQLGKQLDEMLECFGEPALDPFDLGILRALAKYPRKLHRLSDLEPVVGTRKTIRRHLKNLTARRLVAKVKERGGWVITVLGLESLESKKK